MKSFCTLSDINFLPYGLALYNSISNNLDCDFKLYYLCTDDKCYQKLKSLKINNIVVIALSDLESKDRKLLAAKNNQPSYEAVNVASKTNGQASAVQYFWCLSPYLSWYILDKYDVNDVLYVDSDVYFFHDINKIYDEIHNKSVGIVRHRINYNPAVGEYNVGIVYFKNDLTGYQCAEWWKDCLLTTDHEYYKTHGICGDQKYLELFEPIFGHDKVCVIDKKVGHLAPWNFMNHGYVDNKITWQGALQDLVYCHFSNFKPNYDLQVYEAAPRHGLNAQYKLPLPIKNLYDKYFKATNETRKKI